MLKQLLVAMALCCVFCSTSQANWYRDMNTKVEKSGKDWVFHIVGGAIISTASYRLCPDDWNEYAKALTSTAAIVAYTYTVEHFDINPDMEHDGKERIFSGVAFAFLNVVFDRMLKDPDDIDDPELFGGQLNLTQMNNGYGLSLSWAF